MFFYIRSVHTYHRCRTRTAESADSPPERTEKVRVLFIFKFKKQRIRSITTYFLPELLEVFIFVVTEELALIGKEALN